MAEGVDNNIRMFVLGANNIFEDSAGLRASTPQIIVKSKSFR